MISMIFFFSSADNFLCFSLSLCLFFLVFGEDFLEQQTIRRFNECTRPKTVIMHLIARQVLSFIHSSMYLKYRVSKYFLSYG